jgi:hypothetical protein
MNYYKSELSKMLILPIKSYISASILDCNENIEDVVKLSSKPFVS